MADIDKISKSYAKQGLFLTVGMSMAALIVMRLCDLPQMLYPLIVSVVFSIVFDAADSFVWRYVAKNAPGHLPVFYTAVSGFRMLLALITMLVYYLIAGREAMLMFFGVFMAFYLVLLAHHSIFFARVSNRS